MGGTSDSRVGVKYLSDSTEVRLGIASECASEHYCAVAGFGEEQSGSQRGGGLIGVANRAIIAVDEADGGVIGRRSCRRTRNSC